MKSIKKTILVTAGITLLSVIALCVIGYFIMLFCFTANLGDFYYSLGLENMAATLYHRVYEKNDDIYYAYRCLNLEIGLGNSSRIIEYYEDFINDDEIDNFSLELVKRNENLDIGILEKSVFLDEINYMSSCYVNSLVKKGEGEKALTIAKSNFNINGEITLKSIGNYNFSGFITDEFNYSEFSKVSEGNEHSLVSHIQKYFDECVDVFVENENLEDNLSKSYLIAMGNRIITVGNDLNAIYLKLNMDDTLVDDNLTRMEEINNSIMELIK